ncbi:hypothetical protein [Haloparvum sp. AD34]
MTEYLDVNLWLDQNTPSGALSKAEDALNEIEAETDKSVYIYNEGEVTLDYAPYDTYSEFIDNFRYEANLADGNLNMLLYWADIASGWLSCSDNSHYPFAGIAGGTYESGNSPHALINEDLTSYSDRAFKNIVKQEALHACGCEHKDGDNSSGGYNTPMLTGYAESFSDNTPPSTTCDGNNPYEVDSWKADLTNCAIYQFEYHLNNNY